MVNVPGLSDSERPVTLSPRAAERLAGLERLFRDAGLKVTGASAATAAQPGTQTAAQPTAPARPQAPAGAPAAPPAASPTPLPSPVRRN